MTTNVNVLYHDSKKRTCIECGKILSLFEGYRHPTLGAHYLLCKECYEKVEISVERWGRFILWNSFNPDAPDPTFIDNYPFPHEENMIQHKKTKHHRPFSLTLF
jgi:hypothetical protein